MIYFIMNIFRNQCLEIHRLKLALSVDPLYAKNTKENTNMEEEHI